MKSRARPLKDLYFRFGESIGLDWHHIADCLYKAGYIEYLPDKDNPFAWKPNTVNCTYYRDTKSFREMSKLTGHEDLLNQLFYQYKLDAGLED